MGHDSSRLQVPAGTVLFRPGDACMGFVRVIDGCVRVTLNTASGREILLYRVRPGDICLQTFTALAQGNPYAAYGTAETPLTAEVISPAGFDRMMTGDAQFRGAIMDAVSRRFGEFEALVESLTSVPVETRLAAWLLTGAGGAASVAATHQQIAVDIGASRETVSRALARMADQGLVRLARGRIDLLAPGRLAALAPDDAV